MWHRRLGGSFLLFLLELFERAIGMATHLVRSWLRERLGLVAGACRDQREDKQPHLMTSATTLCCMQLRR